MITIKHVYVEIYLFNDSIRKAFVLFSFNYTISSALIATVCMQKFLLCDSTSNWNLSLFLFLSSPSRSFSLVSFISFSIISLSRSCLSLKQRVSVCFSLFHCGEKESSFQQWYSWRQKSQIFHVNVFTVLKLLLSFCIIIYGADGVLWKHLELERVRWCNNEWQTCMMAHMFVFCANKPNYNDGRVVYVCVCVSVSVFFFSCVSYTQIISSEEFCCVFFFSLVQNNLSHKNSRMYNSTQFNTWLKSSFHLFHLMFLQLKLDE